MDTGIRLLKSILNQPQKGLVLLDLDGTVMFANSNLANLVESNHKLRNQSFFKFLLPNDGHSITELVSQLLHNGGETSLTFTLHLRTNEGTYQPCEARGIGIYSKAGMLECIELSLLPIGDTVTFEAS